MKRAKRELVLVSARVPRTLFKAIEEVLRSKGYATLSDFLRSAIREKIEREAPSLLELKRKSRAKA